MRPALRWVAVLTVFALAVLFARPPVTAWSYSTPQERYPFDSRYGYSRFDGDHAASEALVTVQVDRLACNAITILLVGGALALAVSRRPMP